MWRRSVILYEAPHFETNFKNIFFYNWFFILNQDAQSSYFSLFLTGWIRILKVAEYESKLDPDPQDCLSHWAV